MPFSARASPTPEPTNIWAFTLRRSLGNTRVLGVSVARPGKRHAALIADKIGIAEQPVVEVAIAAIGMDLHSTTANAEVVAVRDGQDRREYRGGVTVLAGHV